MTSLRNFPKTFGRLGAHKASFREIALAGFDEAFRAGVLGQQEAYSTGEPQAAIDAFIAKNAR